MTLRRTLLVAAIAAATVVAIASHARAADLPKAVPKANPFFSGYPYTSQGFYWGLNSIGGGGRVDATGIGVNPNAVVTNEVGAGVTIGYVWASPSVFYAVEGMFGIRNFNGSAPGFSMSGPASFEQRFKVGTPLNNFLSVFPGLSLNGLVPPFPPLPGGVVATNVHPYLMAGLHENDISLDYGLNSAQAWRVSPSVGIGMMGQLTNGVAIDVWAETEFAQSGFCAGVACVGNGQKYLVGLAILY